MRPHISGIGETWRVLVMSSTEWLVGLPSMRAHDAQALRSPDPESQVA